MTIKRAILVGVSGIMLALITAVVLDLLEPRYGGKSISYWIDNIVVPTPQGFVIPNDKSVEALKALGPEAMPYLRSALRNTKPNWNDRYHFLKQHHAPEWLRNFLPNEKVVVHWSRREAYARIIGEMGPPGKEGIRDLIWVLEQADMRDHKTRLAASKSLSVLGIQSP